MNTKRRQSGFTLIEMMVVVAIMAILLVLAVPNFAGLVSSQRMSSSANLIKAALAQAQAHAAKSQRYAGIRFQQNPEGKQYLVLIEKVSVVSTDEYRAIPNAKPTALPTGMGVISAEVDTFAYDVDRDGYLDNDDTDSYCLDGAATFSIIFSPTGQLVVKDVRVVPEVDHRIFGNYAATELTPSDEYFRLLSYDRYWDTGTGALMEDHASWCDVEPSTAGLYIYDQGVMAEVDSGLRYTDFVSHHIGNNSVQRITINLYTGTLIDDESW